MGDAPPERHGDSIVFRRPTEDDQPRIAERVDHWFGGRRVWPLVGRTWFRHFAGTSLLTEDVDGAPLGFCSGSSPDRPTRGRAPPSRWSRTIGDRGSGAACRRLRGRYGPPARTIRALAGRSARRPLLPGGFRAEEGPAA
jgi:hypothetical protein